MEIYAAAGEVKQQQEGEDETRWKNRRKPQNTYTNTHEVGDSLLSAAMENVPYFLVTLSAHRPLLPPPLLHPVSPHSQSSCEKQFEQKVSLNLRSRRRHRCLTHRIPPPSASSRAPPPPLRVARGRGKAISYPQSGHFSVSLQPFLLLLLFYSALISKVALRVPKIISNGITLNEMQSTSSTNNKQQQQQQSNNKSNKKRGR